MRLSEAIRLGSLTIEKPCAGDIDACAIAMAMNAIGCQVEDWERYVQVVKQWPWLEREVINCPWCASVNAEVIIGGSKWGSSLVYHPFDFHVMAGGITIEQLADWIASIEPPEPKPMSSEEYDRGLALTRCHGE